MKFPIVTVNLAKQFKLYIHSLLYTTTNVYLYLSIKYWLKKKISIALQWLDLSVQCQCPVIRNDKPILREISNQADVILLTRSEIVLVTPHT